MSELHLRLRQLRRTKNLSQEELAKRLGISRQAVIAIEQGGSLPSLPVILAMLRALDVPFDYLFQGNEWSPFRTLDTEREISQDSQLSYYRHGEGSQQIPLSLSETSTHIVITAELPGVKEEDLTVDLGSQHVIIMAVKQLHNQTPCQTHIQERTFGPLLRIVSLPCPINPTQAQAMFKNGVLQLEIAKALPTIRRHLTFKEPSQSDSTQAKEDYGSE